MPFTSWDCVTLARHLMETKKEQKKVWEKLFLPLTFHRKMIHGYLPMVLTLFIFPPKSLSWTLFFFFFVLFLSTWPSKLLIYPSCHAWRIRSTEVFTQYYMTTILLFLLLVILRRLSWGILSVFFQSTDSRIFFLLLFMNKEA